MAEKKSTQDILAQLRAEAAGKAKASEAGETAPEAPSADAEAADAAGSSSASKPAAKAGGGPKSTKDILAALRAETKGGKKSGDKPAAAKKPETAKPAAAAKPTAVSAGGAKPSVEEMIRVAREGAPAASAEPAAAKPKTLRKPAAVGKAKRGGKAEAEGDRRWWLFSVLSMPFTWAWIALSVTGGAFLLGCARFLMPNVLIEPPSSFKIGTTGDFPPETVSNKFKAEFGIWVVNTFYGGKRMIYALRSVCTHLGCTPNWLESEQKFKCPCHGSGFYINGVNFEGPAPRPLERVGIREGADGLLEVDKSVKFQQEIGQWDDAASFVEVG